jgi:hypothetical protein
MLVEFTPTTRLGTIQKTFRKAFPFLKIEFYRKPHRWYETVNTGKALDNHLELGAVAHIPDEGMAIDINPWDSSGTLEILLKDKLGLYAQVFRRKEAQWIQTAGSDNMALEEQDELARTSLERERGSMLWARLHLL